MGALYPPFPRMLTSLKADPKKKPVAPPVLPDDPEEDDGTQERRRKHLVEAFLLLRGTTIDRLSQIGKALSSGKVNVEEWAKEFRVEMESAHAEAGMVGRRLAGDSAGMSREDLATGEEAWAGQEEFLQGFVDDIKAGKYTKEDGSLDQEAINQRAKLYARRLKGTANESFVKALPTPYEWVMGETEKHCGDCPELARGGPYDQENPPMLDGSVVYPGDGSTQCLVNCLCHLEAEDGHSTEGI